MRWATHMAAFAAGAVVATAIGAVGGPAPRRFDKLDVFAQALSYIENNYVDPVDDEALMYGAVEGMVRRLDRYSAFFGPAEYRRLREDTEGEYGGVGVTLEPDGDGVPVVVEVIDDSPAARAGLVPRDRIVAIGGTPTAGAEWRGALRGRAGSRVAVDVERHGWTAPRSFSLRRENIRLSPVESRLLDGDVGYVRVRMFQGHTAADVRAALRRLRKQAGGHLGGVVLDLRGNPGGLFDEAVRVADLFLDAGVIVRVESRGGQVEEERAVGEGTLSGFPMAVVIDERSASSAEIVAGALRDHGRAVIVGRASFGKGSVQSFLDLEDGSGLKLTTARYFTPDGDSIEGTGIAPEVAVAVADDAVDAAHQTIRSLALSK